MAKKCTWWVLSHRYPVPFVGCFWGYVDCPRAVDVVVGYSRHRRRKHHHLTHASLDLFRKNGSTILKYVFVVVAMGQSRSESEWSIDSPCWYKQVERSQTTWFSWQLTGSNGWLLQPVVQERRGDDILRSSQEDVSSCFLPNVPAFISDRRELWVFSCDLPDEKQQRTLWPLWFVVNINLQHPYHISFLCL